MANFTLDRVARMYEHYFQMVHNVYTGKGWYTEDEHTDELEWLNRYYPAGIKTAPQA